jgi:hypothetical protein
MTVAPERLCEFDNENQNVFLLDRVAGKRTLRRQRGGGEVGRGRGNVRGISRAERPAPGLFGVHVIELDVARRSAA